jgi:hypothetical protein
MASSSYTLVMAGAGTEMPCILSVKSVFYFFVGDSSWYCRHPLILSVSSQSHLGTIYRRFVCISSVTLTAVIKWRCCRLESSCAGRIVRFCGDKCERVRADTHLVLEAVQQGRIHFPFRINPFIAWNTAAAGSQKRFSGRCLRSMFACICVDLICWWASFFLKKCLHPHRTQALELFNCRVAGSSASTPAAKTCVTASRVASGCTGIPIFNYSFNCRNVLTF